MKKLLCMIAFVVVSGAHAFTQNIFIANSRPGTPGGTNVFSGANAINDAVAAAATGDIIYVVPSSVVYDYTAIDKGVTLIGGGFNPDQPGSDVSTINGIGIYSDNTRLSGLVTGHVFLYAQYANTMIDKCRSMSITASNQGITNLIIQNCILGESTTNVVLHLQSVSTGVKISNNIIYSLQSYGMAIQMLNAATIENNLFIGTISANSYAFASVTNCNIKNNIFYGVSPANAGGVANNDQQNNLSYSTVDNTFLTSDGNTSTNNIENQDPLFKNTPLGVATSFSFSNDLSFQAGSPAVGAGVGGTDMGVFGGSNPYDIYGTSLPIIRAITAPNTVSQGTNMNIRIEAKGN